MVKASKFDIVLASVVLFITFYLFFPTLAAIAEICWTDDDYSHGLLLPLVMVYLIWDRKEEIKNKLIDINTRLDAKKLAFSWVGAFFLLFGILVFFMGVAADSLFLRWLAFFPSLLGCLALLFGIHFTLIFAPPILLNFMAKPMPDSLVPKLFNPFQRFAAKVSASLLDTLGVPVYLQGNIIEIPEMRLLVEEACSGMRSLMALFTVALIVVMLLETSRIAKVAILVTAIIVALVLNVVRVAATGVLAHFYDPTTATGFFHTFSGMVVFVIGLAIVYATGRKLLQYSWARRSTASK